MTNLTVLISSAGRRGALVEAVRAAFDSLGLRGRVITTDMTTLSSAAQLADKSFQVPACTDPEFIPEMMTICAKESVSLVVPTIDTELTVLAANQSRFAAMGTEILISSPETIGIVADKASSSRWLEAAGFPVPKQYELDAALTGADGWPLFFKPLRGSASVGAMAVDSADALRQASELHEGVVEELIDGDEYTVDVYVDSTGAARCAVPRLRMETRAGEVSKGMTVRHPAIESIAANIAGALPCVWGPITIQVIDGPDGPRVIEINPRFGGGYPLSWNSGARFIEAALLDAQGLPIPQGLFQWKAGLVMLRYDSVVFVDRSTVDV